MAKAILRKTRETRVRAGHPWIYASEIENVEGEIENGDIIDVCNFRGGFMGRGFYNANSQIIIRMLTYKDEPCDADFFRRRVETAWNYRKLLCDPESCRLIFSESDFLPGLVVDKFADVLVMQSLSLGIDKVKDVIADALMDIVKPRGIYERSDVPVRRLEGMEQVTGLLRGEVPDRVIMTENGIKYSVDVQDGQKTGFFLDQKYNRLAIHKLCKGKRVLDCFTHTGSFALNAGIAGASEVLGVDASELGVAQATENAELNGLSDRVKFIAADVFDLLPELEKKGEKFDVVILDPPAFTKSRNSIKNAVKGYREINLRGMKLVKDGGYLCTCSCSHFMDPELFTKTIREAAGNVHKRLRQVEYRTQAADHPILWGSGESSYLKFIIFQVCDEK